MASKFSRQERRDRARSARFALTHPNDKSTAPCRCQTTYWLPDKDGMPVPKKSKVRTVKVDCKHWDALIMPERIRTTVRHDQYIRMPKISRPLPPRDPNRRNSRVRVIKPA